ncbi:hypothetical protein D0868_08591 [Hortaea werneckii]|uniref:Uncharacterized protein n=2 Tax=Hortaea werneckii TaxID=91943 RepID=A0A3M6YDY2_HORWE|nr:hypothetical protein D0868_08591 [Hortaea werneckii]RMY36291.1 hypothetical protein D0866_04035 [Hortaea werneckii]
MADVTEPCREEYCAHEEWTEGCIACDYIDAFEYRIDPLKTVYSYLAEHPWEPWPRAFQDLVGPQVEELYAPVHRAFPDDLGVGMFVREGHSSKAKQEQGSDEAGGNTFTTPLDRSWQWRDFELEDRKQRQSTMLVTCIFLYHMPCNASISLWFLGRTLCPLSKVSVPIDACQPKFDCPDQS